MALPHRISATDYSAPNPRKMSLTELTALDWSTWLRLIERQRRLVARRAATAACSSPYFLDRATYISFNLDGIEVTEADVAAARLTDPGKMALRSRLSQRIRNHVAILLKIETSLRLGEPLKTAAVLRWYTSISSGLSTTMPSVSNLSRLELVVRRINSPHLRLQPAIQEIAKLYIESLNDELVPSFNGILARLMLRYQLGRCSLPPVLPDPAIDRFETMSDTVAAERMLQLISQSYDALLAG